MVTWKNLEWDEKPHTNKQTNYISYVVCRSLQSNAPKITNSKAKYDSVPFFLSHLQPPSLEIKWIALVNYWALSNTLKYKEFIPELEFSFITDAVKTEL